MVEDHNRVIVPAVRWSAEEASESLGYVQYNVEIAPIVWNHRHVVRHSCFNMPVTDNDAWVIAHCSGVALER